MAEWLGEGLCNHEVLIRIRPWAFIFSFFRMNSNGSAYNILLRSILDFEYITDGDQIILIRFNYGQRC